MEANHFYVDLEKSQWGDPGPYQHLKCRMKVPVHRKYDYTLLDEINVKHYVCVCSCVCVYVCMYVYMYVYM